MLLAVVFIIPAGRKGRTFQQEWKKTGKGSFDFGVPASYKVCAETEGGW